MEFPEQPLEALPLRRTITLVRLGRLEEARTVIHEFCARMDTIKDPMTRYEVRKGPDHFLRKHMGLNSELYPPDKYPELATQPDGNGN